MNPWTVVAAGAAAGACLALRPPPALVARVRWDVQRRRPRRRSPRVPLLAVGLALLVGAGVVLDVAAALAAVAAAGVVVFGWGRWRAQRERARVGRARAEVAATLDLLAAEVRAGMLPRAALGGVAHEVDVLAPVAAALATGSDPPVALRAAAHRPGAEALADVASAWSLAEHAGIPLVRVLQQLALAARDDVDLAREIRAEAAPARATGRLMALLPLLGLGLGAGLGSNPVVVLTRTVPGAVCLLLGAALACGGVAWIERVADAAERPA